MLARQYIAVVALVAAAAPLSAQGTRLLRHPAVTSAIIGPRTMEHLESQLTAADVELSDDLLDRIDEIVTPGTTINPADGGWVSPALQAAARRR